MAVLHALGDVHALVVDEGGLFAQQFFILLLEGLTGTPGLVGAHAELFQGIDTQIDGGAHGFPIDQVDSQLQHLVGVSPIDGAHQQSQLRKVFLGQLTDCNGFGRISHRHDQQLGLMSPRRIEQIQPIGIAVKHLVAKFAQHIDMPCVVVEDGGPYAMGVQQAADDLTEATKADNEHRVVVILDLVGFALFVLILIATLHEALVEDQEHRSQSHRQGDDQGEHRDHVG